MDFVPPSAEQIARTRKDVGADENSIREAKETLMNWLRMQPHLPDSIDEDRLERLYINSKRSLERTKTALDAYFSLRSQLPDFLRYRDPLSHELRSTMDVVMNFPIPQLTSEGYRVNVVVLAVSDIALFDPDAFIKLILMTLEVRLSEDYVPGDVYVFELSKFTVAHVAAFGAARVRKSELCTRTAYRSRIKAIHFVNVSHVMDLLYKILISALSSKIAKRVHVHKSPRELLEHVPAECLPNELGGNVGPTADIWNAWKTKLISYRDWFIEQDTVRSDEAKRPEKNPYGDGLFGCEGSFRKLQID